MRPVPGRAHHQLRVPSTRHRKAAGRLRERGLTNTDALVDVAAGRTELDYCLRQELGWRGRYIPIDSGIDGTVWICTRSGRINIVF
ncbi:MAG: hypothetical protein ACRDYX_17625 [Egibacteraceae bacterium]